MICWELSLFASSARSLYSRRTYQTQGPSGDECCPAGQFGTHPLPLMVVASGQVHCPAENVCLGPHVGVHPEPLTVCA